MKNLNTREAVYDRDDGKVRNLGEVSSKILDMEMQHSADVRGLIALVFRVIEDLGDEDLGLLYWSYIFRRAANELCNTSRAAEQLGVDPTSLWIGLPEKFRGIDVKSPMAATAEYNRPDLKNQHGFGWYVRAYRGEAVLISMRCETYKEARALGESLKSSRADVTAVRIFPCRVRRGKAGHRDKAEMEEEEDGHPEND